MSGDVIRYGDRILINFGNGFVTGYVEHVEDAEWPGQVRLDLVHFINMRDQLSRSSVCAHVEAIERCERIGRGLAALIPTAVHHDAR